MRGSSPFGILIDAIVENTEDRFASATSAVTLVSIGTLAMRFENVPRLTRAGFTGWSVAKNALPSYALYCATSVPFLRSFAVCFCGQYVFWAAICAAHSVAS